MKKIYYRETQPMNIFIGIIGLFGLFIILAGIFQWGSKPVPMGIAILIILLFAGLISVFYNLTISICESQATVQFGVGWLKRRTPIDKLDLSTTRVINLPWYAGVGYRVSTEGTFFNTKPGPLLLIKTKDGSPPLFVGTNNYEEIVSVIRKLQEDTH